MSKHVKVPPPATFSIFVQGVSNLFQKHVVWLRLVQESGPTSVPVVVELEYKHLCVGALVFLQQVCYER